MVDPNFPYRAAIVDRPGRWNLAWNDICADVVEQFGLPGDRFITQVDAFALTLYFKTEQDLLLFKLKWSEYEL